ncbi:DUF2232 domain-containing protein [Paenibacillus sp. IB182496]|uniref:DUF2232 domain-containing protein n=1 Tax=Paenibacillus sabuli TaxID=2772509 RepID=A0A927GTU7_9BACL|nr:DUF2232 domain-containing protein [Paenibacillus sabuli]
MNQEVNGVTTGLKSLLWSSAALGLLVLLLVPGLNLIAAALLIVPFAVLYTSVSARLFAGCVAIVLALGFWLLGPGALMLGIFFLVPAIVMGHLYRRGAQARTVIMAVSLTLLAEFLLELLVFSVLLDISLIGEMTKQVRLMFAELTAQTPAGQMWDPQMTEQLIKTLVHAIPLVLILISFLCAVVAHWVARRVLRAAYGTEVAGAKPARDWMLPRVLVWYYLIALVLDLFVPAGDDSYLTVVLVNLIPLLRFAFSIQAIGFFFYVAYQRGWSKAVPLLLAIPVLIFPPLSLIGVLDVAFPIRKSFKKT